MISVFLLCVLIAAGVNFTFDSSNSDVHLLQKALYVDCIVCGGAHTAGGQLTLNSM